MTSSIRSVEDKVNLLELGGVLSAFYDIMPYKKVFLDLGEWSERWLSLINSGAGKVFGLWDKDKIIGGIGLILFPALEDGVLTTTEAFWFVDEKSRGGGMKLFIKAENWAKESGSKRMNMIHLTNSMPEKLKGLYERRGYKMIETTYQKEI